MKWVARCLCEDSKVGPQHGDGVERSYLVERPLRLTRAPRRLCLGQRAVRLAQHVPLCASSGTAECTECTECFVPLRLWNW